MKRLVLLLSLIVFVAASSCKSDQKGESQEKASEETKEVSSLAGQVNIIGSEAMYPLVKIWADEFAKVYPKTKINVVAESGIKGIEALKNGKADFAMLARTLNEDEKGFWPIPIARDAVVPIINIKNPDLQSVMNWGIHKEKFKDIFVSGKINNWGQIFKNKDINEPIKVYRLSSNNCASKVWAEYLETEQDEVKGDVFDLDSRLIDAVKMDRNSIGFINLAFAYDNYTKYEHKDFKVVPIDFNGNELIDDNEFFYHNKNRLLDAVKDNRFQRPPARQIFLVANKKPSEPLSKTFIKWILSTGRNYVKDAGYVVLDDKEYNDILKNYD